MWMINYWAVLACAIAAFLLGGFWYSPKVFGNTWKQASGVDTCEEGKSHGAKVFIIFFILALLSAFALAFILGPQPLLPHAIIIGFIVGLFFVSASFGINYVFANRSMKLFLIDAGYHTIQFVLYGVILGLWH